MQVRTTLLAGVKILTPKVHTDTRGILIEQYHQQRYQEAGIDSPFVQFNYTQSKENVLRGLHLQLKRPQGKLVFVTQGCIFDVVVDINPQSPTFMQHVSVYLSADNRRQLWVPPGYAHGFLVLSTQAQCHYFFTEHYDPADQAGIYYQDPQLAIPWPKATPILSARDQQLPSLQQFLQQQNQKV